MAVVGPLAGEWEITLQREHGPADDFSDVADEISAVIK
jgi:hypothetical protein